MTAKAEAQEIQRSLGRIEGKLEAIHADIAGQDRRLDDHDKRIRGNQIRLTGTWIAAGAVAAVFGALAHIKKII